MMDKKMKKTMSAADILQDAMNEPLDVREALAPFVDKEVQVSGLIEKLSMTRGKYPKPSVLLVDVKVFVDGGVIELDYIWLVSDRFVVDQQYVFSAQVIEYTTYDAQRNPMAKYGFGNIRRLIKHSDDIATAMHVADDKDTTLYKNEKGGDTKSDTDGVAAIVEVFETYGLVTTPSFTINGKWQCSIGRPGTNKKIAISIEDTFALASIKARDIVIFLCEPTIR